MAGHFSARVDPNTGESVLVPFTAEEEAQKDLDDQAGTAAAQAQATTDGNAATMTDRITTALGNLETAAQNWGTLTAAQKDQATRLAVQVVCRLARLMLRRLDTAI